jgi:hypothetical protein
LAACRTMLIGPLVKSLSEARRPICNRRQVTNPPYIGCDKCLESGRACDRSNQSGRVRGRWERTQTTDGESPWTGLQIDDPLFPFDSPAIVFAAGRGLRQIVDALLNAGANINPRSKWWAGSFGVLDSADPELAAYLIERGGIVGCSFSGLNQINARIPGGLTRGDAVPVVLNIGGKSSNMATIAVQ